MSKANDKAKALFAKPSPQKKEKFQEAFEKSPQGINPIEALFGAHQLTDDDKETIQALIEVRYNDGMIKKDQIDRDLSSLIELSSQIRGITKQSLILHGERVSKGQEILKRYKRGAFTAWLELTYGNRQTPYNFLYYYNLYRELPSAVKPLFEKIPYKAAYLLGSRGGSLEKKIKVIENNCEKSQKDLIVVIDKTFPLDYSDRRVKNDSTVQFFDLALYKLKGIHAKKGEKPRELLIKLEQVLEVIEEILSEE